MTLSEAYDLIEGSYRGQAYDHRPFIFEGEPHPEVLARHRTEDYRVSYACFKYTVAWILQPKSIIEIGVRSGVSALAFLHACPAANFLGIDSDLDARMDGVDYCAHTLKMFEEAGFKARIEKADSQELTGLYMADFIHIDGCHSRLGAYHDVSLAIKAKIPWILVDDGDAETVYLGTRDALARFGLLHSMVRFDSSYGQSILIKGMY